jgi:hypothetical protein
MGRLSPQAPAMIPPDNIHFQVYFDGSPDTSLGVLGKYHRFDTADERAYAVGVLCDAACGCRLHYEGSVSSTDFSAAALLMGISILPLAVELARLISAWMISAMPWPFIQMAGLSLLEDIPTHWQWFRPLNNDVLHYPPRILFPWLQ